MAEYLYGLFLLAKLDRVVLESSRVRPDRQLNMAKKLNIIGPLSSSMVAIGSKGMMSWGW
jgi:hypothetical protein